MRSSHGATGRRRRLRRHGSRGSASVEHGLLVALISAALCLGIGVVVKTVFNDAFSCIAGSMPGQTAPPGCGGSGGGGAGGGGGGVVPDPDPDPDPSPAPTDCPTEPLAPGESLPDGCPEPTPSPT